MCTLWFWCMDEKTKKIIIVFHQVTEEANLTTAKKLHVSEKSWAKLATHFTILLSDKDTELLTNLQTHVEKWRDLVEEFNIILKTREEEMKVNISSLKGSIQKWMNEIRKICLWVTLTTRITFRCSEYKILQNSITVWMKIDLLQLTRAPLNQILAVHCIWTWHNIWWFVHLKILTWNFHHWQGEIFVYQHETILNY